MLDLRVTLFNSSLLCFVVSDFRLVSMWTVTYYCRLGDLCFVFIVCLVYFSVIDVLYVSLQYFDIVGGWVF